MLLKKKTRSICITVYCVLCIVNYKNLYTIISEGKKNITKEPLINYYMNRISFKFNVKI